MDYHANRMAGFIVKAIWSDLGAGSMIAMIDRQYPRV